jgi:hypothetical protein
MLVRQGLRDTFAQKMANRKNGKSVTWRSHLSKHIKYFEGHRQEQGVGQPESVQAAQILTIGVRQLTGSQ